MTPEELMKTADGIRENSYSPYSDYTVGAALLCRNGRVYTGCNIENSAFSSSVCAERTAFFKAVSEGVTDFTAIAVSGGTAGEPGSFCPPCGVCRQVMSEFCDPESFLVYLGTEQHIHTYLLQELLPLGFRLEQ